MHQTVLLEVSGLTILIAILDRIAPLTQDPWPSEIRFFCDSIYYQNMDKDGKTWDQVKPKLDALSGQSRYSLLPSFPPKLIPQSVY